MKAFVAITLLAACAAAQTIDHQTGLRQLLRREHGLFKDIYGIGKDFDYDTLRNVNTYPYTIPSGYNTNIINNVDDTLTLEELLQHPLFPTYYAIPLFRQSFSHPLFRLFLTTPNFQRFWTQHIFTTFFRNPYLFNKYIYPIVYNTVATGVYDRDFGLNAKNIFGDYKFNTQTTPFGTIFGNKYTNVVYPFNTGYPINSNHHIQYANIVDKIIKSILVNTPDVNFNIHAPIEKKTFEKVVDPITGVIKYTINLDDFKTTGEKITPIDKIVERELIKNAILKKIFLNKVIYEDHKIEQTIPETFNTNKYETIPEDININQFENLPRDILAKYTVPTDLTKKFEKKTTPLGYFNRFSTIPRESLVKTKYETIPSEFITKDEQINKIENIIPQEIETNKNIETENKIENIKPETIEKETKTIRVRRDADTTTVDAAENIREGKTYYYVPLTHTYGHQLYTVPTTQYVVGEQHQAQVPLTKDASTVYTPVTQQVVYNAAPLGYHYGTHYTVPTYGVQSSHYYPTQTYITA